MKRIVFILCLVLALAFGAIAACAQTPQTIPQSREQVTLSFAPLVKQVTPAVVNIYTQRLVRQRVSPLFDDPFFRQFFGGGLPQGMTRQRMENSLGSGVIVRPDGLIVTSRHVIVDADQIRVVLSDRREFDAKLVMSDEHADLAILRIDAKGTALPYLALKDSDDAQVGDLVLAIGNPFGVGQTVTMGIVSALTHQAVGAGDYGYFIQTDAAINPGNSGGALVTMDGKLVGINASIYSRDGGNMGIGFAVPSNLVRTLIAAVTQGKKDVTHPWLGLEGQEITQDIAASLGMPQPSGFLVKSLNAASPAAKAGLRVGDVIVALDGRAIEDMQAFRYRIATLPIGSTATIGIMRKGQKLDLRVDMSAPPENIPRQESLVTGQNPVAGAKIATMSPALAEQTGLSDDAQGVVIVDIKDESNAAAIGLQPGDILTSVNGRRIQTVEEALTALKQPSHLWRLTIRRGDSEMTMMFRG